MEVSLDLTDSETAALRAHAAEASTSVGSIVAAAVRQWMERRSEVREIADRIVTEDAELLRRLSE